MIYSLFFTLAFCLLFPLLSLNRKNRDKYLSTFSQRLGKIDPQLNPESKPSIWIHAVSVGEALAAKSLVAKLRSSYPEHLILVSTTTSTGNEIARKQLNAHGVFYFPFDWKFAVRRIFKKINPSVCVVMETEIWPNFAKVLKEKKVPLVLANGRISDRSYKGYQKIKFLVGPVLKRYHSLCAQSKADAQRLINLGAHPWDTRTSGNLKYGADQFKIDPQKVETLRRKLEINNSADIFIAGSTHEEEETAAIAAFRQLLEIKPDARLILVPRKPERFDEVHTILEKSGLDFARYTEINKSSNARVLLIDTIGLLTSLYHLAHVAFVGGSLSKTGGHNLLEASSAGLPVLFGPNMHNFREVRSHVLKAEAGYQVEDAAEMAIKLKELFSNKSLHERLSQAASGIIGSNQQALPITMSVIADAMAWSGSRTSPPPFLKALSCLHSHGAAIFRKKPEKELQQAKKLSLPVISVGGLTFGGAGKTPMVSLLIDLLQKAGINVCLLTRGYKGTGKDPIIVSDGENITASAEEAGDEPVMLARQHKGLMVVKDADRYRGARLAQDKLDPDVFIMDDGFQHRRLARDINILMLDADSLTSPRAGGQLFREPLAFARCADLIILLSSSELRHQHALQTLNKDFPDVPVVGGSFQADHVYNLTTGERIPAESISTKSLLALSGIAAPGRFLQTLRENDFGINLSRAYPDHHNFSEDDISRILDLLKLSNSNAIITTEKDAQRLVKHQGLLADTECFVLAGKMGVNNMELVEKLLKEKNIL